jgi:hypothetical protein
MSSKKDVQDKSCTSFLGKYGKIKGPAEIIEMIQTGPTLDVTPLLSTLINALS